MAEAFDRDFLNFIVNDPNGLAKLNAMAAYFEEKTNALQKPPIPAASEAEMLALEGVVPGNTCIRTDITDQSPQFVLTELPANTLSNWLQMPMPVSPVNSVNKLSGNVNLTAADIKNTATGKTISEDYKVSPLSRHEK